MKIFYSFLSIFCFIQFHSYAQVIDFSVSKQGACPGDLVEFTNKSTGTDGYEAHWLLGEGQESVEINPSMRYQTSGAHSVTLEYLDATGAVVSSLTKTDIITVYKAPVVSIIPSRTEGCRPLGVRFEYSQQEGGAQIEYFKWEFNDGSPSDFSSNPLHVFNDERDNNYQVTLYVEDEYGCSNGSTFDQSPVTISTQGMASTATFAMSDTRSCQETQEVGFTITAADDDIVEYHWDFGDGETLVTTEREFTHTYNGYSSYYPSLVVANADCESSEIHGGLVALRQFEASAFVKDTVNDKYIDLSEGQPCAGELVIKGQATSTGKTVDYSWSIDGVDYGTEQSITIPTEHGKTYNVLLTATSAECTSQINVPVQIEGDAGLSVDLPPYLCSPQQVEITASSSLPDSDFEWDLRGFLGSQESDSSRMGELQRYYFGFSGVYSGILKATSANGCPSSLTFQSELENFSPKLYNLDKDSCAPFFARARISLNGYAPQSVDDPVKTVSWSVDGVPVSSLEENLLLFRGQVQDTGKHELFVDIETELGCSDTMYTYYYGGESFPIKYTLSDTTVCAQELVEVHLISDYLNNFTSIYSEFRNAVDSVNFYADKLSYTKFEQNFSDTHRVFMAKDTGLYRYALDIRHYDCPAYFNFTADDTINKNAYVYGPIVDFVVLDPDCDSLDVITDSIIQKIDVDRWYWEYGDGSKSEFGLDTMPTHTYAHNGVYFSKIIAETDHPDFKTCQFIKGHDAKVNTVNVAFEPPAVACSKSPLYRARIVSNDGVDSIGFRWYYRKIGEDTIYHESSPLNGFGHLVGIDGEGLYSTWIASENSYGCVDYSDTSTIKIYQPHAAFAFDTLGVCPDFSVQLRDVTETDTSVVAWNYTLIKQSTDSLSEDEPDTSFYYIERPIFTLEKDTSYRFIMNMRDELGCLDTTDVASALGIEKYYVNTAMALDTLICSGTEMNTLRANSGADSVVWDMGDGSKYYIDDEFEYRRGITHLYQDTGMFEVKLYLTDTLNFTLNGTESFDICGDSASKMVEVRDMSPKIVLDKEKLYCKSSTKIIKETANDLYTSYAWYKELPDGEMEDMGNRDLNKYENVELRFDSRNGQDYALPGDYKVVMVATTEFKGCEELTDTAYVHLGDFEFEIAADKYEVCLREDVNFYLTKNKDIDQFPYYWFLDDGKASRDIETNYAYEVPDLTKTVSFVLDFRSDSTIDVERKGKCVELEKKLTINIKQEYIKFERGAGDAMVAGCPPYEVQFVNQSKNVSSFKWDFGDGHASTEENPLHVFSDPNGVHSVKLESDDAKNCKSADVHVVTTYPVPDVALLKDTVICYGESVDLTVESVDQQRLFYAWSPDDYSIINNDTSKVSVVPEESVYYFLDAANVYDCRARDSVFVGVIPVPDYEGINADLIVYDTLLLENDSLPGFVFRWEPADDLSCTDCASPLFYGLQSADYTLYVKDTLGCFNEDYLISINVYEKWDIDLPEAFTPNSDGENDIAYAKGWGIKEFLNLQIYNRWGQMVFETETMDNGWDGTYNGSPQPVESYTWMLKAKNYNDEIVEKKGYISLLR